MPAVSKKTPTVPVWDEKKKKKWADQVTSDASVAVNAAIDYCLSMAGFPEEVKCDPSHLTNTKVGGTRPMGDPVDR